MENQILKIENFNLLIFKHLLNQSLNVTKQLMIEFSDDFVKSVSISNSKSLMKIWVVPMDALIGVKTKQKPDTLSVDDLSEDQPSLFPEAIKQPIKFDAFNFYALKGDDFVKYLNATASEITDIEFNIQIVDNKRQASSITIYGKSINGNNLKTTFNLSKDEMMLNVVSDFSGVIKQVTPDPEMAEVILNDKQTQEIKRLVKTLHKSCVENTGYLTFAIEQNKVIVNDKVFNVTFDLDKSLYTEENLKKLDESIVFNILKADFIMTGALNYHIYTSNSSPKIILGTPYAGAIIWCLATKISESNIEMTDETSIDNALDGLNIEEYGLLDGSSDEPF